MNLTNQTVSHKKVPQWPTHDGQSQTWLYIISYAIHLLWSQHKNNKIYFKQFTIFWLSWKLALVPVGTTILSSEIDNPLGSLRGQATSVILYGVLFSIPCWHLSTGTLRYLQQKTIKTSILVPFFLQICHGSKLVQERINGMLQWC